MKCVSLACLCMLAAPFTAHEAYACSLYFGKTPVNTEALTTCHSFARDVARLNLHNVRQTADEVAGETNDAYASITCIAPGHGEAAIAVIMVVSSSSAPALQLRDLLVTKMRGIKKFDWL